MTEELRNTLLQLAAPVLTIAAVLVVCRVRRWPVKETLAVRVPAGQQTAIWLAAFAVYLVTSEYVFTRLGLSEGLAWGNRFTNLEKMLRVFGMVLLAPVDRDGLGPARGPAHGSADGEDVALVSERRPLRAASRRDLR